MTPPQFELLRIRTQKAQCCKETHLFPKQFHPPTKKPDESGFLAVSTLKGSSKNLLRGHLLHLRLAKLRVSAQYLRRSLRFFEVP